MEQNSNLIFEFNDAQILFGMFQGFKKVTPYGCAWKLSLSHPSVRCDTGSTLIAVKNLLRTFNSLISKHNKLKWAFITFYYRSAVYRIKAYPTEIILYIKILSVSVRLSVRQGGVWICVGICGRAIPRWNRLDHTLSPNFFRGGIGPKWKFGRTKMKNWSENFSRASGAQKKGFPNFSPAAGFFRRGGTENR